MKTAALVLVAGAMLVGPQGARANTRTEAVPVKALKAHTIYVENRTNSAEIQNETYLELAKWGRFQIVDSLKKADVVLRLTGGDTATFVPTGEKTYLYNSSAGGHWQDQEEQIPGGFTQVLLLDAKTGGTLWSEQRKVLGPKTKSHITDGFREAFELSERSHWK
jgi:hypothetical protein